MGVSQPHLFSLLRIQHVRLEKLEDEMWPDWRRLHV